MRQGVLFLFFDLQGIPEGADGDVVDKGDACWFLGFNEVAQRVAAGEFDENFKAFQLEKVLVAQGGVQAVFTGVSQAFRLRVTVGHAQDSRLFQGEIVGADEFQKQPAEFAAADNGDMGVLDEV